MPIIKIILELEEMITDKEVSGPVRDTIIDLILKNLMHMDGGLPRGWSWRFVEDRGTSRFFITTNHFYTFHHTLLHSWPP
jgi:hypothetical protein